MLASREGQHIRRIRNDIFFDFNHTFTQGKVTWRQSMPIIDMTKFIEDPEVTKLDLASTVEREHRDYKMYLEECSATARMCLFLSIKYLPTEYFNSYE